MIELNGSHPPKEWVLQGRYAKDFFNPQGKLKHISKLKFWALVDVLKEKYSQPDDEASEIASFLMPMLAWEPSQRQKAADALNHPWLQKWTEEEDRDDDDEEEEEDEEGTDIVEDEEDAEDTNPENLEDDEKPPGTWVPKVPETKPQEDVPPTPVQDPAPVEKPAPSEELKEKTNGKEKKKDVDCKPAVVAEPVPALTEVVAESPAAPAAAASSTMTKKKLKGGKGRSSDCSEGAVQVADSSASAVPATEGPSKNSAKEAKDKGVPELVPEQPAPKKEKQEKKEAEGNVKTSAPLATSEVNKAQAALASTNDNAVEDEWKEYDEEKKDYSNLKIETLKVESDGEEAGNDDEHEIKRMERKCQKRRVGFGAREKQKLQKQRMIRT